MSAANSGNLPTHVLIVSDWPGDTRRYRCVHLQEQLDYLGIRNVLYHLEDERSHPALEGDAASTDLLILHRVAWSPRVKRLLRTCRRRGTPVVYETDDLVFAPELYHAIGMLDTLPGDEARRFRENLTRQARTFAQADCVLTTTEALAAQARQRGKPAFVHRNAASEEMIRASQAAYTHRQRPRNDEVILAYFSGSASHDRDFATITPVLHELLERYPHARLHAVGPLWLAPELEQRTHQVQRHEFVPWQKLPGRIAQVDINLAPLELENPFCQTKSEIKWMEAGLVGVPTVASATDAFRFAIRDGHDGFLATDPASWQRILSRLIEEPALRRAVGDAAYRKTHADYEPATAASRLSSLFSQIQHAAPPPRRRLLQGLRPLLARLSPLFR